LPPGPLILRLPDSAATDQFGRALADAFPGVLQHCLVVFLRGELGTGKTTLVRGFLRGMGVSATVRSPTYTLIEVYEAGGLQCVHADLYRLRSAMEFEELGVRDFLSPGHVVLIEWPERGGPSLPPPDLEVGLDYAGEGRAATVHAATDAGIAWLTNLGHDTRIPAYLSNLT
jgi:tRNA threonylcarbamoyladenosine biosynthesis protein TsaE